MTKILFYFCSVSPLGLQFLSPTNAVHQTPLILPLTAEMVDEEEHGCQQNKLGDLPNASTLACEGFSEVFSLLFFVHRSVLSNLL